MRGKPSIPACFNYPTESFRLQLSTTIGECRKLYHITTPPPYFTETAIGGYGGQLMLESENRKEGLAQYLSYVGPQNRG